MSSSKIERALHGPSWTEVLLGAALSVLLGAVLAAAHLVFKPVAAVRELPKEQVPGQVYFVEGSPSSSREGAWLQKHQALLEGQSVALTEEDLNTAVRTPVEKPKAGEAAVVATNAEAVMVPGPINFRIASGELQMAVPMKVPALGVTVFVQTRGGFAKGGDSFRFSPSSSYIGSWPIHRLPMLEGYLLKRMYAASKAPAELSEAWGKLKDVSIEGKTLKLSMQ